MAFGQNVGQQLIVAIRLCSLSYSNNQGISSANGLILLVSIQVCLNKQLCLILLWYCTPRDCRRETSAFYLVTNSFWITVLWELHQQDGGRRQFKSAVPQKLIKTSRYLPTDMCGFSERGESMWYETISSPRVNPLHSSPLLEKHKKKTKKDNEKG